MRLRPEDLSPIVKVYHSTRNLDNPEDFEYSPRHQLVTFDNPGSSTSKRFLYYRSLTGLEKGKCRSTANSRPRGMNYPTFNVSFGRTETRLRLSPSPKSRENSSNPGVMDIQKKGRVAHVSQTYDMIKGEERISKVREDKRTHKYEVAPATPSISGLHSVKPSLSSIH